MDNQNLSLLNRIQDSDIYFSFIKSPTAIISTIILIIIFFCSFFVEIVAPFNPFDPSSLSLMDAFTPPSWSEDGISKFLLGTDGQGRDMLSTILYGSRISLIVGFAAIVFSLIFVAHFVPYLQEAMMRGWEILELASDYFWIIILTITSIIKLPLLSHQAYLGLEFVSLGSTKKKQISKILFGSILLNFIMLIIIILLSPCLISERYS